jgi:hypothetical protein
MRKCLERCAGRLHREMLRAFDRTLKIEPCTCILFASELWSIRSKYGEGESFSSLPSVLKIKARRQ